MVYHDLLWYTMVYYGTTTMCYDTVVPTMVQWLVHVYHGIPRSITTTQKNLLYYSQFLTLPQL